MSLNSRNQGFSYYICLMIEGSGSGSRAGSGIPLTNGSGSGRPKNTRIRWIRIRIRNTDGMVWHKALLLLVSLTNYACLKGWLTINPALIIWCLYLENCVWLHHAALHHHGPAGIRQGYNSSPCHNLYIQFCYSLFYVTFFMYFYRVHR